MDKTERRATRRISCNLPLIVQGTDAQGEKFCETTTSINISSGGVYFRLNQPVDRDCEVSVSIIQSGGRERVRLGGRGRVVRHDVVERHGLSGRHRLDPYLAVQFVHDAHGTSA